MAEFWLLEAKADSEPSVPSTHFLGSKYPLPRFQVPTSSVPSTHLDAPSGLARGEGIAPSKYVRKWLRKAETALELHADRLDADSLQPASIEGLLRNLLVEREAANKF